MAEDLGHGARVFPLEQEDQNFLLMFLLKTNRSASGNHQSMKIP